MKRQLDYHAPESARGWRARLGWLAMVLAIAFALFVLYGLARLAT